MIKLRLIELHNIDDNRRDYNESEKEYVVPITGEIKDLWDRIYTIVKPLECTKDKEGKLNNCGFEHVVNNFAGPFYVFRSQDKDIAKSVRDELMKDHELYVLPLREIERTTRRIEYKRLDSAQKLLLDAASMAMDNAYNPYSHFFVGAALLSQDGKIIIGTNHENASYGNTICAERAAIFNANTMGIHRFDKIAVITKGKDFDTTQITGPCGACRQTIYESSQVSGKDLEVILATTKKDQILITTISALLPFAFGPLDLGIDVKKYR